MFGEKLRLLVLAILAVGCSAYPYGTAFAAKDGLSSKLGWIDIFSPYIPPVEKRKSCAYKGSIFEEGAIVVTEEPCLKCRCLRGSLVCYLRVCPLLPDPPPANCVLLLRHGACCSELICEDGSVNTNHISRSEPGGDFSLNTTAYRDGCIANGTLYASGSAMWTDRPCQYCYCIAGKQRCVQPRCLPSPDGCFPRRASHSCCPVKYECIHDPTTTSTTSTNHPLANNEKGCQIDGVLHPEGEKITSVAKSLCDNCFCMRGMVRCVPLSCAPPLLGCTPNILPGECCASSYNCTKHLSHINNRNDLLETISKVHHVEDQGTILSERSFPDDTPLSPSQIADILMNGDERNYRRIEANKNITETKEDTDIDLSESTTETISITDVTESNNITTTQLIDTTTTTPEEITSESNLTDIKNSTENNATSDVILSNDIKITKVKDIILDESKTLLNDTVNCTTEISSIEYNVSYDDTINNKSDYGYHDIQERTPILTTGYDDVISLDNVHENLTGNSSDKFKLSSNFPSTSLIIPKGDDIFMVNVSTYVRTNNSNEVTLRPVAAIPPDIEALLNISLKKNNQKDDYFDYDYKSQLPPSLPNLEIIPFLAIDAVPKVEKIARENEKEIDHFATVYPSKDDEKSYLELFSTIPRDKYNATPHPYKPNDGYNPTTYSPYPDDKYLSSYNRNPVIYKQHINDKFQPTTYNTMNNEKYDGIQYGIEKYDATVYPSLTIDEALSEKSEYTNHNLFSPPAKTEGGFLPKEPSSLEEYFNLGFSGESSNPVTDGSVMITNHAKINTDNCVSNGREYKNGELITEPHACVICFCYYGDIHCQDPECPPIKPGCRRIIEKASNSCCGIEICRNDQHPPQKPSSINKYDKEEVPHESTTMKSETVPMISTKVPYYPKDITTIKYVQSSRPSIYTTQEQSTLNPSIKTTLDEIHSILYNTSPKLETSTFNERRTETTPYQTTLKDIPEIEEEEDEFSFDSVLKLLLGDSSDITTKYPIRTTRRYTTQSTTTTPTTTTQKIETTSKSVSSTTDYYKPTHKYQFKNNRTAITNGLLTKDLTKPIKITTRQPAYYSTVNRPTKYKYPHSSTTTPPPVQIVKKIPFSSFAVTTEPPKVIYKKPSELSLPFGAGLLKLAGCNIYGRMYRVGKIISELSSPCLECMCTEVGVQCTPLPC